MRVLFLFFTCLIPAAVFSQSDLLIPFELEDQFKRVHSNENFHGRMIVLIASHGGGSKYNNDWGRAIEGGIENETIKEGITWLPVADLSNVPFFLKGFVRGFFPDDKDEWVLMDWEGKFDEAYTFEKDKSNILIFNFEGRLVYQNTGTEVDHSKLYDIISAITHNYQ
jgi:hypothetical protein